MLDFSFTNDPWVRFSKVKVVTAPALPSSQEEDLCAGKDRTVLVVKISTPLQGLSFRKAVTAVMGDLGIDDKIIEK